MRTVAPEQRGTNSQHVERQRSTQPAELATSLKAIMTVYPWILHFGFIDITGYGLMMMVGFLVGRWGEGAGGREAARSGLATALIASALAWSQSGLSLAPLAGLLLAVPFAAWGGRVGGRRRGRVHGPGA